MLIKLAQTLVNPLELTTFAPTINKSISTK